VKCLSPDQHPTAAEAQSHAYTRHITLVVPAKNAAGARPARTRCPLQPTDAKRFILCLVAFPKVMRHAHLIQALCHAHLGGLQVEPIFTGVVFIFYSVRHAHEPHGLALQASTFEEVVR